MAECIFYNNCNHKDCDKSYCARRDKVEALYELAQMSPAQCVRIPLRLDVNRADAAVFKELSQIEANIGNFVNSGSNIYIHSKQCGNGKTSWANRLLQAYANYIWPYTDGSTCRMLFISVPQLLLSLKDNITTKSDYVTYIKNNVDKADLVVWDDIAAKVGTDFEINNLFTMIDSRLRQCKANIYTSNLDPCEMYAALGERLTSRVCNYSKEITLVGADKRKCSVITGGLN